MGPGQNEQILKSLSYIIVSHKNTGLGFRSNFSNDESWTSRRKWCGLFCTTQHAVLNSSHYR